MTVIKFENKQQSKTKTNRQTNKKLSAQHPN